mgnify:FL=1
MSIPQLVIKGIVLKFIELRVINISLLSRLKLAVCKWALLELRILFKKSAILRMNHFLS